jgi:hypothetical protein
MGSRRKKSTGSQRFEQKNKNLFLPDRLFSHKLPASETRGVKTTRKVEKPIS